MTKLVVFGGLPGVGKSTIARELCSKINAQWIRVDTVEHCLIQSGFSKDEVGTLGYELAQAIARDNLLCGQSVVADSVNPVSESRKAWRKVATETGVKYIEIELFCSDEIQHQERIQNRKSDIKGFVLPTWDEVLSCGYEPWQDAKMKIDSCKNSRDQIVQKITNMIETDDSA